MVPVRAPEARLALVSDRLTFTTPPLELLVAPVTIAFGRRSPQVEEAP